MKQEHIDLTCAVLGKQYELATTLKESWMKEKEAKLKAPITDFDPMDDEMLTRLIDQQDKELEAIFYAIGHLRSLENVTLLQEVVS